MSCSAPCFYLGKSIPGSPGVSACHHELRYEASPERCQRCPDFEPRVTRGQVKNWAVGMVTAPRQKPTLERSLQSLVRAGWDDPHLFVEPDTEIPAAFKGLTIHRRTSIFGPWPNWFMGLWELVMSNPHADAYMMCEDDVIFAQDLRSYLEKHLWPGPQPGVVSLYCATHHIRTDLKGFYEHEREWFVWGALAYVFPNASARALLRDTDTVNYLQHHEDVVGRHNTDTIVSHWRQNLGLPFYLHSPSLAQHIGDQSTVFPEAVNAGRRNALAFVGEDTNIETTLRKPSPNMTGPPVTVFIAYFQCRETIRRSVESILQQTYQNLTLIVINDADEPPWDLLEDVKDPRLVCFDLPTNRGCYFAAEVALQACESEFFMVQDADDWSEPRRLEVLMNLLANQDIHTATTAICFHRPTPHGDRVEVGEGYKRNTDVTRAFTHRASHSSLFRTETLRKVGGYYGGFRIAYDTLLCNFLILIGKWAWTDEPLYHRLIRPESLTQSSSTGFGSITRKSVYQTLAGLYTQAYDHYCAFQKGAITHTELCSQIRRLSQQNVSKHIRGCLIDQSNRLKLLLEVSKPSSSQ